ncbi:MAG: hypothetical protein JNM17_22525 [Archangium sp.]|nr:hypothetical protein [Archangium sp.]
MVALTIIALVLGGTSLLISLAAVIRGIARGSNGGYAGFIAAAVSIIGGLITIVLSIVVLIFGSTTMGLVSLGLGVLTPLLIIGLILFFVPKSAFRL